MALKPGCRPAYRENSGLKGTLFRIGGGDFAEVLSWGSAEMVSPLSLAAMVWHGQKSRRDPVSSDSAYFLLKIKDAFPGKAR